jgi:hypothetical protein
MNAGEQALVRLPSLDAAGLTRTNHCQMPAANKAHLIRKTQHNTNVAMQTDESGVYTGVAQTGRSVLVAA